MRSGLITMIAGLSLLGGVAAQGMGAGHGHGGADAAPMAMPAEVTSELGFLQHMIDHHAEAVASAEALLAVAEREELRTLAREVIAAQSREIALMESWLATWYPDAEKGAAYEPMMRDIVGLSADDAERAFLEDMIVHHMMAVHDARHLLLQGLAEHDEVAALAVDIVATQMSEIHLMQGWLRSWYGSTGGMGGTAGTKGMSMQEGSMPGMAHGMEHGMMHGMHEMQGMHDGGPASPPGHHGRLAQAPCGGAGR